MSQQKQSSRIPTNYLEDYMFVFRSMHSNGKQVFNVQHLFGSATSNLSGTSKLQQSAPTVMAIKHQFMDTFFLPVDEPQEPENVFKNALTYRVSLEYANEDKTSIYQPRPDHHECRVCRSRFEDYTEHINNPYHIEAKNKNQYTSMIREFCEEFSRNQSSSMSSKSSRTKIKPQHCTEAQQPEQDDDKLLFNYMEELDFDEGMLRKD